MNEHLKTPTEWAAIKRLHILDPDGWRGDDSPKWDEPISELEFDLRAAISTVGPLRPPRPRPPRRRDHPRTGRAAVNGRHVVMFSSGAGTKAAGT